MEIRSMNRLRTLGALAMLAVVPACLDMDVVNLNEPDADRALASASDVEALLSTGYFRFWNGTQKYLSLPMMVSANEITSSWGNWGMNERGERPRIAWDNSPTYANRGMLTTPWGQLYEAISNVTDGIVALESGLNFVGPNGEDLNPRALAYARFVQGISHGWLAMTFDQAIIFDETINLEDGVPAPSPYTEVMAAAQRYLEEAIAVAEANSFTLPAGDNAWINERPLTNTELAQWAHSYLARYLAGIARTPAERATVDWARVVYHAERGVPDIASVEGDGSIWWWAAAERPQDWIRAAHDLVGPADESGSFAAWKATPMLDRNTIVIETSDRRIHGAEGPTSVGKYFRLMPSSPFGAARGNYFQSRYFQQRFAYHRATSFRGEMPAVQRAELDLLRAEARLRNNNIPGAVELINKTRVANGEMTPLAGTISSDEAWKWLMYEKLIETAFTQGGLQFWERRGWGTLACRTPIHYPIPGTELEQLEIPNYTFGGDGEGAATPAAGCMAD
ncbi:MAG: hypothetical protein EA350_16445 [Gemmatimonadales bacterium]|nr:MAG: hypothetical protein EA350_16445 [Gemmatimonadales bacterium]